MKFQLKAFCPVAESISLLLYPHAEVVLHDLTTGRIAALFNNLSKRKVGDESLLEELGDFSKLPDVFPLYFKTNWDGRRMKCVTSTIRDQTKKPIGLLCINVDLSKWEDMHEFLSTFMKGATETHLPATLFKDDWREKINQYVSEYLKKEGIALKSLTKDKKRELVLSLHREGAFQAKHAAAYMADIIGISRATIYNYLRG